MHIIDKSSDIVFQDRPRGSIVCKQYNFPFGLFSFYTMLHRKVCRVEVSPTLSVTKGDSVHKALSRDLSLFSADVDKANSCVSGSGYPVVCAILIKHGMVTLPDCKSGPRKQIGVVDFGVSRFESYLCHIIHRDICGNVSGLFLLLHFTDTLTVGGLRQRC